MEDLPVTTRERKCPKPECGSTNVAYQGAGHAAWSGPKIPKVWKHQYKCGDCGTVFWFLGEHP